MRKAMPRWALPRTDSVGLDYRQVRARLGAQAVNANLTEQEIKTRGRELHAAWMEKTTAEQRREWARAAGAAGARSRWGSRRAV